MTLTYLGHCRIALLTIYREGRCALQTSFAAFKYMILYPVIQLMQAARLYAVEATLGDFQYLYMDIAIVLPLAVFSASFHAMPTQSYLPVCWTGPYPRLSRRIPTSSLFNARILASLCFQILMNLGGIAAMNAYLASMRWYQKYHAGPGTLDDNVVSLDNAVTFLFGNFPYIITAIAFSTSFPFRKPIYTNRTPCLLEFPLVRISDCLSALLLITLIAGWTCSSRACLLCSHFRAKLTFIVVLLLCPLPHWLNNIFQIDERLPFNFRFQLWYFAWALLTLCWGFEVHILSYAIVTSSLWPGIHYGGYCRSADRRLFQEAQRCGCSSASTTVPCRCINIIF